MGKIIEITDSKYEDVVIDQICTVLKNDGIVIMPSDTIYGFLCNKNTETRLRIVKRREEKPFINLINDIEMLKDFDIDTDKNYDILQKNWPGKITFIINNKKNTKYGFRMPAEENLIKILNKIEEPLISTSVNFSGLPAINDIEGIKSIFVELVDLIILDNNFIPDLSSSIYDISFDEIKIVREGSKKIIL